MDTSTMSYSPVKADYRKILWQGDFLDGKLTVTYIQHSSNVIQIFFCIKSFDTHCDSMLDVNTLSGNAIDTIMEEIQRFYLEGVMLARDEELEDGSERKAYLH